MVATKQQALEIAAKAREDIERIYGKRLRGVYLYGSAARDQLTLESDIDIAVVVDRFSGDYLKVSTELFGLVRSVNKRIEPVLLCRSKDRSGFLQNVLRNGKIIYKSPD